jgi:hypothetical protein
MDFYEPVSALKLVNNTFSACEWELTNTYYIMIDYYLTYFEQQREREA